MSDSNDIELIKAVRTGDLAAFSQIIDKYQHMAFTLANGIVKNKQEAEEVTQDAFFKAYKALDKFKGKAVFSTWLYRIVYNTALSKLRSRKPETSDLENKELLKNESLIDDNSINQLERKEKKKVLKMALARLKEDDAFILILYYYKELSIEEIEKATDLSKSNIKVKLHRGRKQLQKELKFILQDELKSFI